MNTTSSESLLANAASIRRAVQIAAENWQAKVGVERDPRRAAALQALVDSLDAAEALLASPLDPSSGSTRCCLADVSDDDEAARSAETWAGILRKGAGRFDGIANDGRVAWPARACAARLSLTLELASGVMALAGLRDDAGLRA